MVERCEWKTFLESLTTLNTPNIVVVKERNKLESLRASAARLNAYGDKAYRYEVVLDYPQNAAVVTLKPL